MTAVFWEIKKKGREKELFGEHAYIAFQPITGEQHEKEHWAKRLRHHGAVMRNIGNGTFVGLEHPDAETVMERYEAATEGLETYTTTKMKTSVRKLLTNLTARDGQRLWQTLYLSWEGEWRGTFIGMDKRTLAKAHAISTCLTSYLRVFCSRYGYKKSQ